MRGGHVPGEPLPGLRAALPGRQGFKQQQMLGDAQDLRGAQVPGSAQRGQALGLDGEQITGRIDEGLADDAAAVGIADQPDIRDHPAGHALR